MSAEPLGPPEPVRRRLLARAAQVLGDLEPDQVPVSLRKVRSFAPARRASAGAGPLWAALDGEVVFRQQVAGAWRAAHPAVAEALDGGQLPEPEAIADEELLAGLYLLQPQDWPALSEPVRERLARQVEHRSGQAAERAAARRVEAVEAERDRLRAELGESTARIAELEQELATIRRDLRRARSDADRLRAQTRLQATEAADREQHEAERARRLDEELAGVRAELDAERRRAEAARQQARTGRALADARVRLLLDAVVDAGAGLRRELALPPVEIRPAEVIAEEVRSAVGVSGEGERVPTRGRADDDPGLLAELIAVPQSHLIVDGYNVTKTGYPEVTLVEQRRRLVDGLTALAARTGIEVTCCFDGAEATPSAPATAQRGVRVLFSLPPMNADELIRRLVHAEPQGRPLIVVSTDREVGSGVRRAGARVMDSLALVRLLGAR